MPTLQAKSPDFTATDILSPAYWSTRAGRPAPGIDVVCTKIAVDLQNLPATSDDAVLRSSLESLREAAHVDAAFIAHLDETGSQFGQVLIAREARAVCRPDALHGAQVDDFPLLFSRREHLRLSEIANTADPAAPPSVDATRLRGLQIGALLVVFFHVEGRPAGLLGIVRDQPEGAFDVNLRLLLKLVGSSLATGLERQRFARRLAVVEEREAVQFLTANDGVWDFDIERNDVFFSPRWKAMLGYDDAELAGAVDWRGLVHPEDMARVQEAIREHVAGRLPLFESTHRMRHRNGEWRWISSRAKARVDGNGRLLRLIGVEHDITERKLYEESLFREKESAQITLQSIGDGVITTDENSVIDYINPVAEQLTGWRLEDAMGKPVDDVFRSFHEETCEPLENPLTSAIRRSRASKSVRPMLLIRQDGNELYVETTAAPVRDGAGQVVGAVLVFRDVSESRELNRKLSYHESHDQVTGLVNRREFEGSLDRALRSARAQEAAYTLCVLDIDQFRIINDSCGHGAGDALLGQIGSLLKSKIRWRDTLSRLGADEFGILFESCGLDEAMRSAETLREAVRNFRFVWEDRQFRIGASIGVVPITAETGDVASLLQAADSACQTAKEQGRNRVHSFAENDIELMRRRREMQWVSRINVALEEGRFELYRMPIKALQEEEHGAHYEMLLRMRDEGGRILSPDTFFTAAERYGLMPGIDRWVIENTFRWLVSDTDEREGLSVCAINLSGQSLGDDKFLPFVIDQFERSGLDAKKICFEITETAAVSSFAQANRFIQSLKALGCQFSLDDFGTGMSSFGYLKHFPVDYLKIDGSFVRHILTDEIDREMVRSINQIGKVTGKKTIAEFAENDEIIAMLRDLGLDYAQGYGVAVPSPVRTA